MTIGYTVITASDLDELRDLVEQHLAQGWQLVSGAGFVDSTKGGEWYQTMQHPALTGGAKKGFDFGGVGA